MVVKTNRLTGPSSALDGLNLPSGMLAVDTDRKALRVYDGVTPGGFEMVGVQAVEPPVGPGPETLTGGDATAGFYGEVLAEDFISGGDLATAVGLSAGTLQYDTTSWLKFALDGKILFSPKKAIRHSLSWLDINNVGAVDGSLTVSIGGSNYIVRLMRTGTTDPIDFTSGVYKDPVESHGSEWNRLMYRICEVNPTSQVGDNWASYTVDELGLTSGNGYRTHMQETLNADSSRTFNRGYHSGNAIDGFSDYPNTTNSSAYGWRPLLELVV